MTQISHLTTSDPRSAWQKISRRQCWRGATKLGLEFNDSASHTDMVDLFMRKGINPEQVTEFVPVSVPTADGKEKTVMYPDEKERKYNEQKEHQRMEEFERRIAEGVEKEEQRLGAEKAQLELEKNTEITKLKSELEDMKGMIEQLLKAQKKEVRDARPKETDPLKMKYMAQKKWLKDRGKYLYEGQNATDLVQKTLNEEKE